MPKTDLSSMSSSSSAASTTASPTRRILCLHGWLDNAASFHRLAPLLLQGSSANAADAAEDDNNNNSLDIRKTEIVALDFPGA